MSNESNSRATQTVNIKALTNTITSTAPAWKDELGFVK
jgi:hypothetical protein